MRSLPEDLRVAPFDDAHHVAAVLFENEMLPPAQRWPPEASLKIDRTYPDPTQLRLIVVDTDDTVVATAFAKVAPRPGTWSVNAHVGPARRRQGIGGHLLRRVEAHAIERGASRLVTLMYDGDPDARAFAERRGYREFWRRTGWAMRLASFDPRRFPDVETIAQEAGVRIVGLRTALETMPGVEAQIQQAHRAILDELPLPFRPAAGSLETYARNLRSRGQDADASAIAVRGDRVLGVHLVATMGNGLSMSMVTGAVAEGRGKRLGLALKLYALRVLRDNGNEWVATMNDADNAPTLRILRSLGYEQEPALIRFERLLQEKRG